MLLLRHLDKTSRYALLGGTAVSHWIECSSPRITLVLLPLMVRTVLRCRQGAKISSGPSFYICCRLWLSCQGSFREAKHISQFSSVQFCHSVMSDSLRPHESQHARPPCQSPTPGVYSSSCPLFSVMQDEC